jgi:excisionase family DNA binding protein
MRNVKRTGQQDERQKEDGELTRLAVKPEEAARLLGLSRNKTYDAIARGEIPAIRIGARILVPIAGLRELLAPAADRASRAQP